MMAQLEMIAKTTAHLDFDATFAREFAQIGGISIDYAVMEQAENVVLIEAPFDWDDLGSWQALARQRGQDAEGNTIAATIWASRPPAPSFTARTRKTI